MEPYASAITFLYYDDLAYGKVFMTKVMELPLVMDQGFACIYQLTTTSYVGVVQRSDNNQQTGDTLISINVDNVDVMHQLFQTKSVENLTNVKHFESIPLHSFFFSDREGHRFEIQQFIEADHITTFLKN